MEKIEMQRISQGTLMRLQQVAQGAIAMTELLGSFAGGSSSGQQGRSKKSKSRSPRQMPIAHAESGWTGQQPGGAGAQPGERSYTFRVKGQPAGIESAKQALRQQGFTTQSVTKDS